VTAVVASLERDDTGQLELRHARGHGHLAASVRHAATSSPLDANRLDHAPEPTSVADSEVVPGDAVSVVHLVEQQR
jgi:hypothetical protein